MAREYLPRLSWWKKRTAEIYKQTGVRYSPTALARLEKSGGTFDVKSGITSYAFETIQGLKDPRAKSARAENFSAVSSIFFYRWQPLADANYYVSNILTAAGHGWYIPYTNEVISSEESGYLYMSGAQKRWLDDDESEQLIDGAIWLDLRTAERLIEEHAKKLKEKRDKDPTHSYEDE